MEKIKVLLADDHEIMRCGLRAAIEAMPGWSVCGEAATGREAVELAAKLHPEIVVMDMTMPDMNGLIATRQIKKQHPKIEVLMFTGHETEKLIRQVFEAGARSYILKTAGLDELVKALRALAQHKAYFTTEVGEILFAKMLEGKKESSHEAGAERLSDREREIVQLLAEGSSNKDLAEKFHISVKTVETHRAAIIKKLRFRTFSDLVRYAIRNHLVAP